MAFQKSLLVTILVVAFCCGATCQEKRKANEIVQEMAKQFRSADTYQVSGSMKTVSDMQPYRKLTWGQALTRVRLVLSPSLTFSFYFDRPDKLRFDWLSVDHKVDRNSSIWTKGKQGYSWLPSSGQSDGRFVLLDHADLRMLLQDADFHESSSIASILYAQLTGDARAFTFDEMKEAEIAREEVVDGSKCFVILGTISNDPWSLWIDKSTFTLRKMRLQISLTSFDEVVATGKQNLTIGEIRLVAPKMNSAIPATVFSYRPRFRKKDIDISK